MNPIYVDLDDTLVTSDLDRMGNVTRIHARPGAGMFLRELSRYGEPVLLTHALRAHVDDARRALGRAARYLTGVISREDLEPVSLQLAVIHMAPRSRDRYRRLLAAVEPIAMEGVVFDDMPVDSPLYELKAAAVGIGPELWIQVDRGDWNGGLAKALGVFLRRFVGNAA